MPYHRVRAIVCCGALLAVAACSETTWRSQTFTTVEVGDRDIDVSWIRVGDRALDVVVTGKVDDNEVARAAADRVASRRCGEPAHERQAVRFIGNRHAFRYVCGGGWPTLLGIW